MGAQQYVYVGWYFKCSRDSQVRDLTALIGNNELMRVIDLGRSDEINKTYTIYIYNVAQTDICVSIGPGSSGLVTLPESRVLPESMEKYFHALHKVHNLVGLVYGMVVYQN